MAVPQIPTTMLGAAHRFPPFPSVAGDELSALTRLMVFLRRRWAAGA